MSLARLLAAFAAVLTLAACATAPVPEPRAMTVLVSIDGFRPDYLGQGTTPTLDRLAAEGASGTMRPSFPSKTFPNHYALVTGLRPDRNGVVDNNMLDPEIPGVEFKLSNKQAVADARWWNDATPVWVSAERAGVRSATLFWPGSEAAIHGVRPSLWLPFDQSQPSRARVDQLLAWLDAPGPRPGFVTLYFDEVDTAGHFAPQGSPELSDAIRSVDEAIGRLRAGLQERAIAANLVIVSDHGMAPLSADRRIYLEDLIPRDAGRWLTLGAMMTFYPAEGRTAEVERALLRSHAHLQCWRKGELPARFRYGAHRRVAPIFCLPETGWTITTREWVARAKRPEVGNHGFDPFSPEMAALFIGHGPGFRPGARLAAFDNVSIYPLVMRLLGLRPEAGDGRLADVTPALRR
jgi:predicted AlkP superfamily pyrophosphatase or phosphodiesterase